MSKACNRRLTYEKQTPIIFFGPFEKWGIDAIGPLPMAQSRKQYIIVGVDYMTRWVEAAATICITTKDVAKFMFENIFCRFGTPLEIISDRGPSFRGDLVGKLMEQQGISRRHSYPYYPQCNGLVNKAEHRKQKFDEGLKEKGLRRKLVLRYDNHFDTRKDKKFMNRWKSHFLISKKYTNCSYRLQDISGKLHKTRVNGWRLKPFFQRFDSQFTFDTPAGTEDDEDEQPSSSNRHKDLEIGLEA
ncbi:hypothetical protein L7F22_044353 [Adiantum nelumboides]|nr:hypothetical protein [Adiantum nelumboides]